MHYGQKQVTVHPIVTYYTCPKDRGRVKEDVVLFSDDIKHDSVSTFQKLAYSHLKDQRNLDKVKQCGGLYFVIKFGWCNG